MAGRTTLQMTELLGLAWSFGWPIAGGVIAGYYLDQWLETTPLCTMLLAVAALVTGVRRILALVQGGSAAQGRKSGGREERR